ncbi:MAG: AAA family ATPase [Candidatus Pacearchaeota archaeon]
MKHKGNIIAIMSPKGGVGKTVTTANLAAALALVYDKKVLAVDTNVSTASLGMHFGIFFPEHTLQDISGNAGDEKSLHVYHQNLHIIPASIKIKKKEKNLNSLRENLYSTVKNYEKFLKSLSDDYYLILLDCSPGFDLETLAAMQVASGLIIVTNPDYPSIITAARAIEYAKKIKMPVGGLVLNQVRKKKYELKKEHIEDALKIKILEEIPYDRKVQESIANRKPVVLFKQNSKSGRAFQKLAASICGEDYRDSWIRKIIKKVKR